MLPFYMTAETRQALIAESNRLLATRSALTASRKQREPYATSDPSDSEWPMSPADTEKAQSVSDSAFARFVSDLQSTSAHSD